MPSWPQAIKCTGHPRAAISGMTPPADTPCKHHLAVFCATFFPFQGHSAVSHTSPPTAGDFLAPEHRLALRPWGGSTPGDRCSNAVLRVAGGAEMASGGRSNVFYPYPPPEAKFNPSPARFFRKGQP